MDTRLDRSDLDRRDDRDLLVREAFDVAEQQRGPLLGRQGPERRVDDGERFAVGGELRQVGTRRGGLGPRDILVVLAWWLQRQLRPALPGPQQIERAVRGDAEQPGAERRAF